MGDAVRQGQQVRVRRTATDRSAIGQSVMSKRAHTACLAGLPRVIKLGPYDWTVAVMDDEGKLCGQATFEDHHFRLWPANLTSPSHISRAIGEICTPEI